MEGERRESWKGVIIKESNDSTRHFLKTTFFFSFFLAFQFRGDVVSEARVGVPLGRGRLVRFVLVRLSFEC